MYEYKQVLLTKSEAALGFGFPWPAPDQMTIQNRTPNINKPWKRRHEYKQALLTESETQLFNLKTYKRQTNN